MNSENATPPSTEISPTDPPAKPPFRTVLFFTALLVPPALNYFAAGLHSDGLSIGSALVGSVIGGAICGTLLARRIAHTTTGRTLLGLLFFAIFGAAILVMSMFGCAAGGFTMNFR